MVFAHLVLLLLIGAIGAIIFYLLRVPTPALLGAFTIIAVLGATGFTVPQPPPGFLLSLQIILGLYVGTRLNREVCKQFYTLIKPIILTALWSIAITVGVGLFLFTVTKLDLRTAILGASPGGVDVMCIVAYSIGADTATVGLLQVIRLILILILFPLLFKHRHGATQNGTQASIAGKIRDFWGTGEKIRRFRKHLLRFCSPTLFKTIFIAVVGGYLGSILKLPAGGMVGALTFTAGTAMAGVKLEPPPRCFHVLMQIGIGIIIGLSVPGDMFHHFQKIFLPVTIASGLVLFLSFGLGKLIHNITGWKKVACYLAAAPGGFTPMILLAAELDSRPFEVSMLQLARLLTIQCVVPFLVLLFH